MHRITFTLAIICCFAACVIAENTFQQQQQTVPALEVSSQEDATHTRSKRTLFLKKKLLGAGLLGFGLGVAKGFKFGYHSSPDVHRVYVAPPPPPVRYVEYVEKPIYVQRIVEKPVYKHSPIEYEEPWPSHEPSPVYGSW